MDFNLEGTEHEVSGNPLVPIGGKLPYYQELRTSALLDVLMALTSAQKRVKNFRKRLNSYLYAKTRPGFYLEISNNLHLAYGDQRDGHRTQHWWRLFFDDHYKDRIEQAIHGTALAVSPQAKGYSNGDANASAEWGGMYFRSRAEIKVAEALDSQGVLFFANARGRVSWKNSPVSEASGWLTGRVEIDFLVFYQRKCLILEVDGQHHQEGTQVMRDYVRDRVLLREGIPTVRFTARECLERSTDVVAEFLKMF